MESAKHVEVKDSNGNILNEGDAVQVIKEIECRVEKVKGLVLKTCFLKKA